MRWLILILACVILLPLSACGNKGKLKSPSEIEHEQAKKEKEAAKKEKKKKEDSKSAPSEEQEKTGLPLSRE